MKKKINANFVGQIEVTSYYFVIFYWAFKLIIYLMISARKTEKKKNLRRNYLKIRRNF